ncbi:MAG: MerR family transcriptional regulator [Piscinibacter sp.]|nr:MerR family transcriptional regulator [Piscinibacter sp.]
MKAGTVPLDLPMTIAAVERDTGIGKDTLRAWERRYGFPQPVRSDSGERLYPAEQVHKLRLLKRLVERGGRPGQLARLDIAALVALQDEAAASTPRRAGTDGFLELIRAHDVAALRRRLRERRSRLGLARFVTELVAPLNTQVGEAWMRGQLQVFEEHLYTESIQLVLREAVAALPAGRAVDRPRVLLTTFPGEPHGLGLLMAEALFTLDGAAVTSLGVATPLWDIVLAAQALAADIVALSFSGCMNPGQVVDGLAELRSRLPSRMALWAGGAAPVLHRCPVPGVTAIAELEQIGAGLQRWRQTTARP